MANEIYKRILLGCFGVINTFLLCNYFSSRCYYWEDYIMIDHAQRIQNKREIEQMKSYIDPMLIAIAVALALIIGSVMLDKYAASKHGGEIKTAAAFAACLSGAQILVGDDGIANCRVVSSKLVNGL